ncbi:MAG: hypothetical protein C4346_18885, partial [Chloroflexota bacterium]
MATLVIAEPLTPSRLATALDQVCREALPAFLPTRRWFGDKARIITAVQLAEAPVVAMDHGLLAPALVSIAFQRGDDATYFVPLLATRVPPAEPIAELLAGEERWWISDALHDPVTHAWLLAHLDARAMIAGTNGTFRWETTPALSEKIEAARQAISRVSAAQQSNTSIIYGEAVILKVFRRIQPGINPEVEIGRFLTTRTSFRHVPALLAAWSYVPDVGEPVSLAVAQEYVPSVGDGWDKVLRLLQEPDTAGDDVPRRLGEI